MGRKSFYLSLEHDMSTITREQQYCNNASLDVSLEKQRSIPSLKEFLGLTYSYQKPPEEDVLNWRYETRLIAKNFCNEHRELYDLWTEEELIKIINLQEVARDYYRGIDVAISRRTIKETLTILFRFDWETTPSLQYDGKPYWLWIAEHLWRTASRKRKEKERREENKEIGRTFNSRREGQTLKKGYKTLQLLDSSRISK